MAWACSWYSMLLGSYSQPPMGQDICFITSKASLRVPTLPQRNSPLACFNRWGDEPGSPRGCRQTASASSRLSRDSESTAFIRLSARIQQSLVSGHRVSISHWRLKRCHMKKGKESHDAVGLSSQHLVDHARTPHAQGQPG